MYKNLESCSLENCFVLFCFVFLLLLLLLLLFFFFFLFNFSHPWKNLQVKSSVLSFSFDVELELFLSFKLAPYNVHTCIKIDQGIKILLLKKVCNILIFFIIF